uniref:Uncharacterized protein n=1 Tax=Promethearchaeum syntrophicum TaxID=2594042 RepID=A0A5B9DAN9_9ARCH|nr:hypothetical protein DSAG12_01863 [Candidatus Prometheoarchaeum syntrophicum]
MNKIIIHILIQFLIFLSIHGFIVTIIIITKSILKTFKYYYHLVLYLLFLLFGINLIQF